MESTLKFGYPRELWEIEDSINPALSPTAKRIRARQKAEEERKKKLNAEKEKRRRLKAEEKERRRNLPHLSRKDAERVVQSGDFLSNFRRKSKWIERTLGINMEHMENVRDRDDDFFDYSDDDDDVGDENENENENVIEIEEEEKESNQSAKPLTKQNKQQRRRESVLIRRAQRKKKPKNYLKLKRRFGCNKLSGRPIGNINFSASNRDWFGATYFIAHSKYSTDTNGRIGIWNFMLPKSPEYELTATNMITSTYFHPTDTFLVFGSTINGQILMWDLRNNSAKPIERSNFSNGHAAPVFEMSFLPNIRQKQAEIAKKKGKQNKKKEGHDVQHILSVSNDGKLCIWRTDQLSVKPQNQCILKPADDHATARQIELITTCFDYSYRDSSNIVLGSDEGFVYKAEIIFQKTSEVDKKQLDKRKESALSINESINAHYGPITAVEHFPTQSFPLYDFKDNVAGLYLTASYDWTVKLWHNKINVDDSKPHVPFSVFDEMTDYVYDCKWNIGGKPGVFACCDGEGKINLFDIAQDFKHPVLTAGANKAVRVSEKKNIAATCLQWTQDGKFLACGDSAGNVLFYNVHRSLSRQTLESCEAMQFVANKYIV